MRGEVNTIMGKKQEDHVTSEAKHYLHTADKKTVLTTF